MTSADPSGAGLPRRARIALPVLILLLALLSWHRYSQTPERPFLSWSGFALGTNWTVKVAEADLPEARQQAVARSIAERLERVDRLMSTWKEDSELSRFNRHASPDPFPIAPETLRVFEISEAVSRLSDGAFDVTVGPLVDAWGFGAPGRPASAPDAATLEALRQRVGWRQLRIDKKESSLRKDRPDVVCDLSAVAKGYAVDLVAEGLLELGHPNHLVEIGGELRARGSHLDGSPWRVAIEQPDPAGRSIHRIVELRDRALATSGDYRNRYEIEGQTVAHAIDPRTGRPADHGLASVTVVHPEAAWADALATALQVAGPEAGRALAEAQELPAYFIVREPDGSFRTFMTPAFEPMLVR